MEVPVAVNPGGLDVHVTLPTTLAAVSDRLTAAPAVQDMASPFIIVRVGSGLTVNATGIRLLVQPLLFISI